MSPSPTSSLPPSPSSPPHPTTTTISSLYPFRPPPATLTDLLWVTVILLAIWGAISILLLWKLKATRGDEYVSRAVSFIHAAVSVVLCVWCLTQRYDEHIIALGVGFSASSATTHQRIQPQSSLMTTTNRYHSSSSAVSGFVLCHAARAHQELFPAGDDAVSLQTSAIVKKITVGDSEEGEEKVATNNINKVVDDTAAVVAISGNDADGYLSTSGGCPDGLILNSYDGGSVVSHQQHISSGRQQYMEAPTHYLIPTATSSSAAISFRAAQKQAYFRQLAIQHTSSPISRFFSFFSTFGCFPSTSLPSEQLAVLVSATYFTVDLVGIYTGSYYDRLFVLHHVVSMAACYGTAFIGMRSTIDEVWALATTMSTLIPNKGGGNGGDAAGATVLGSVVSSDDATMMPSSCANHGGACGGASSSSTDTLFKEWTKLRAEKRRGSSSSSSGGDDSSSSAHSGSSRNSGSDGETGYAALASGMEMVLIVFLLEGANPLMHLRWLLITDYNRKRKGSNKQQRGGGGDPLAQEFEEISCGNNNNNGKVPLTLISSTSAGNNGSGSSFSEVPPSSSMTASRATNNTGNKNSKRSSSGGNVYIRTVPFQNTCPVCCPNGNNINKSPTTTNGTGTSGGGGSSSTEGGGSSSTLDDQQYLQLVGLANRVVVNPSTYTVEEPPLTPLTPSTDHRGAHSNEVHYRQPAPTTTSNTTFAAANNNNNNSSWVYGSNTNNNPQQQQQQRPAIRNSQSAFVSVRQFSGADTPTNNNILSPLMQSLNSPPMNPTSTNPPPYRIQMSPSSFQQQNPSRSQEMGSLEMPSTSVFSSSFNNNNNGREASMSPQQQQQHQSLVVHPHTIGRSLMDSMRSGGGGEGRRSSPAMEAAFSREVGGETNALLGSLTLPPPATSAFKEVTLMRPNATTTTGKYNNNNNNEGNRGGGSGTAKPNHKLPSSSSTSSDNMIAVTFFPEPVTLNTIFDGKSNSLVVSPLGGTTTPDHPQDSSSSPQHQQLVTFCTCCASYFLYQGAQSNNSNNNGAVATADVLEAAAAAGSSRSNAPPPDVVHLKRIFPRQTLIMNNNKYAAASVEGSPSESAVASPTRAEPQQASGSNFASRTHSFSSAKNGGGGDNAGGGEQTPPDLGSLSRRKKRSVGTEGLVIPSRASIANTLGPIKKLLPASWSDKLSEIGDKIAHHQRKAARMFDSHVMLFSSVPTNRYFSDDSIAAAGYDPLWVVEHAADFVLEAMEEVEAALYIPPAIPHVVLALRRPPARDNRLFAFIDAIFVPVFVGLRMTFGLHILYKFSRCSTTPTAMPIVGVAFFILSAQFIVDVIRKNKRRELWL